MKTAEKIIRGVEKKNKSIIMLDLEEIGRPPIHFDLKIRPDDKENPLRLNVLEIGFSNEDSEEVEIIVEAFSESLKLSQEQTQTLWETLRTLYRRKRTEENDSPPPAISSIITEIQRNIDPQRVPPESSALLKILVSLTEGNVGKTLNSKDSTCIEDFLRGNILIDLGKLRNTRVKKLIVSLFLASLTQSVKSKVLRKQEIQFYLVLKEVGSILDEDEGDQRIVQKTLLELKKIGVSLLLIQASPKRISPCLLERCQTRICHRLTNHEDIDLTKKILNIGDTERTIMYELSNREALVKTEYYAQSFLVQILKPDFSLLNRREDETPIEEDILEIVSITEEDKLREW